MNTNLEYIIALLAALAIGLWIYGDATDRKLREALMWGVAGFLFGIFGFIAYALLVIRPDKKTK